MNKNLFRLEGVKEDVEGFAFDAVVLDDDAGAADDLTCGAFLVELAESGPFAKRHLGVNLHEVDFVVSAEGFNEFAVLLFVAVLGEHAEVGKTFVKGLGSLVEATGKSVVDERVLEHLLEGFFLGERNWSSWGSWLFWCLVHGDNWYFFFG